MESTLKIVGGKAFACKVPYTSLGDLLSRVDSEINELKVMHSQQLSNIEALRSYPTLIHLNLSSNCLTSITAVQALIRLQTLDVRSNRIVSLHGVQKCVNLIRLDASHNLIGSMQGLDAMPSRARLEELVLVGNRLTELDELSCLKQLTALKEVYFYRGKASNPFCADVTQYLTAVLRLGLPPRVIIDGRTFPDIAKQLTHSGFEDSSQVLHHPDQTWPHHPHGQPYRHTDPRHHDQQFIPTPPPNFLATTSGGQLRRTRELEQMLSFKQQIIDQLRTKLLASQRSHAQVYKELLKRESESQRLAAQVSELSKQIDIKDHRIAQTQEKSQTLLKTTTENNKAYEIRLQETEKLRGQIIQMKIENAELKALHKDAEKRCHQMQTKTLGNIEERATRAEEMRRRYEETLEQNRLLQRDHEQVKDRVRELTQLLREWEFKYQSKLAQIESTATSEREELLRDAETRLLDLRRNHEAEITSLRLETRHQVDTLESEYSAALEAAREKLKASKRFADEKTESETNFRTMLKTALEKNKELEGLVQQFQAMVLKLRSELEKSREDHDSRDKTLQAQRNRYYQLAENAQRELAKINQDRTLLEKQAEDQRETIRTLSSQLRTQQSSEQLETKVEELTAAVEAKNAMLDDKNDAIDSLKTELETLRRDLDTRVDSEELTAMEQRKQEYKQKCKEIGEQLKQLAQQNDTLKQQLEASLQNEEKVQAMITEFADMQQLLEKQQQDITAKNEQVQEMIRVLQECKRVNQVAEEEAAQFKRQAARTQQQMEERERETQAKIRAAEADCERRLKAAIEDRELQRKAAIEELEMLTRRLRTEVR